MKRTVAQHIASTVEARSNCIQRAKEAKSVGAAVGADEWTRRHEMTLRAIAREHLPSGSGIDNGTTIDVEQCRADRLTFMVHWHRMDPQGYYAGWHWFRVDARPTFNGLDIRVRGIGCKSLAAHDRESIKDIIADRMRLALESTSEVGE